MRKQEKTRRATSCYFFALLLVLMLFVGSGWAQSGTITPSNFGFQCGFGSLLNCENPNPPPKMVWIASPPQPGLFRLHDAGTYWSVLNTGLGSYDWSNLDAWLDLIAQHEPIAVAQQFSWVPCWDTPPGSTCTNQPIGGTNVPPKDLNASGSSSFNAFVKAFVQHCSPNGNCVGACPTNQTCASTNLIQYYQMWNEWDLTVHWTGTLTQLYQMITPAVGIIRQYIPTAIVMMPSATPADSCYASNFGQELNLDAQSGPNGTHLSDWIDFHVYLTASSTTTNTPEVQWANYVKNGHTSTACNSGQAGFLDVRAGLTGVSGWSTVPWVDSETNFDASSQLNYHCPSDPPTIYTEYSLQDCVGQMVRWQLLHDSNGAMGLYWYYWNTTIGNDSNFDPIYFNMMTFLTQNGGGKFTNACSNISGTSTWTCNFTQGNSKAAQFVWTTSEAGANYSVPGGYGHYFTLTGQYLTVQNGTVAITVEPIALTP